MSLSSYSDPATPLPRKLCECGNAKSRRTPCCARCRYLDGEHPGEREIIELLRTYGEMTTADLVEHTGRHATSLRRSVQAMLKRGRIRRYWREGESREGTGRCRYGGMQRMVHTTAGCWVVVLAGGEP